MWGQPDGYGVARVMAPAAANADAVATDYIKAATGYSKLYT
jgi:hypothetical protein